MKRFKQVKTRLLLFLISGILLLSIGFVGCGTGPETKTTVANRGAYAVDFSAAPSELGFIDLGKSIDSMAGLTGFTIEAWVKPNTDSLTGGIFSRSINDGAGTSNGITLVVPAFNANYLVFAMVIDNAEYSVTSTTALSNGTWTHVAGVFHAAVHGSCSSPHLDIYINGSLEACTNAVSLPAFSYSERIGRLQTNFAGTSIETETNVKLDAVIDEVRFWKAARTDSQIQTWMNKEINETNWNQANPNNELIGYWKLNEGAGSTIVDSSGTGNGGVKNYCTDCAAASPTTISWDGGWVTGKL